RAGAGIRAFHVTGVQTCALPIWDHGTEDWALRVYLTRTRDFVTFTEPEIWLSLNEHGDGQGGPNIIDTTIAKEGDTYYRFSTSSSEERRVGIVCLTDSITSTL